jgi:hypothetical protein
MKHRKNDLDSEVVFLYLKQFDAAVPVTCRLQYQLLGYQIIFIHQAFVE